MNLEHVRKLLHVKGDDPDAFIALNRKAAEDLDAHVVNLTTMLVGVEECTQSVDEFRLMMIRLCPDAKRLMQHTVGIARVIAAVAEHLFLTGSGDPSDIAKFRYQLKTVNDTGQLSLSE